MILGARRFAVFQEVEIISLLAVVFVCDMELIQRSKCLTGKLRNSIFFFNNLKPLFTRAQLQFYSYKYITYLRRKLHKTTCCLLQPQ